ncbi:hypothetical protein INS49_004621 [Diaporthe citri]|uniref:uncharacterized protein n=1 Tax=Diaporthe citri TaxID=83186 RepID=UPI001C7ED696|nr:uncharacterized protein INS49_004621 [Diaporthe citri]KAG6354603.1 hypothetical protein INS49_004621 [Diaporthe citri]
MAQATKHVAQEKRQGISKHRSFKFRLRTFFQRVKARRDCSETVPALSVEPDRPPTPPTETLSQSLVSETNLVEKLEPGSNMGGPTLDQENLAGKASPATDGDVGIHDQDGGHEEDGSHSERDRSPPTAPTRNPWAEAWKSTALTEKARDYEQLKVSNANTIIKGRDDLSEDEKNREILANKSDYVNEVIDGTRKKLEEYQNRWGPESEVIAVGQGKRVLVSILTIKQLTLSKEAKLDTEKLENSIVEVYVAILNYSAAVKEALDRSYFTQIKGSFRALTEEPFESLKKTVEKKDNLLEKWEDRVNREYEAKFREDTKREDAAKIINDLGRFQAATKHRLQVLVEGRVLDWLSPKISSSTERHEDLRHAIEKIRKEDDHWFLRKQEYVDWKKYPQSVLWLHAPCQCLPGYGKSSLCSTIIENLATTRRSDIPCQKVMVYWYSQSNGLNSQVHLADVNGWLMTICNQNPPPNKQVLLEKVKDVIGRIQQDVFIVLDGRYGIPLQSKDVERKDVLQLVHDLVKDETLANLHVLLMSTFETDIKECLMDDADLNPVGACDGIFSGQGYEYLDDVDFLHARRRLLRRDARRYEEEYVASMGRMNLDNSRQMRHLRARVLYRHFIHRTKEVDMDLNGKIFVEMARQQQMLEKRLSQHGQSDSMSEVPGKGKGKGKGSIPSSDEGGLDNNNYDDKRNDTEIHLVLDKFLLILKDIVEFGKQCDWLHGTTAGHGTDNNIKALTFEVFAAVVRLAVSLNKWETDTRECNMNTAHIDALLAQTVRLLATVRLPRIVNLATAASHPLPHLGHGYGNSAEPNIIASSEAGASGSNDGYHKPLLPQDAAMMTLKELPLLVREEVAPMLDELRAGMCEQMREIVQDAIQSKLERQQRAQEEMAEVRSISSQRRGWYRGWIESSWQAK